MIGTIALTVMIALSSRGQDWIAQKRTEAQCRLVWTDRSGKQWRGRVTGCEEAWKHYRAMLEKRRDVKVHVETVRRRKR